MIKEDEDIPMRVVVEAIKLLPEIESEKAAVKVVQKLDLSTKHVEEIIEDSDVSLSAQRKMAEEIKDEEARKKQQAEIKKKEIELKLEKIAKLYKTKEYLTEYQLVDKIKEINLDDDISQEKEALKRLLAKTMACNQKIYGSIKTGVLSQVMPVEEMFALDIASSIEKEYEKIDIENPKPYDREGFEQVLLEQIADNITRMYDKTGELVVIPSQRMRELSQENQERFIDYIEKRLDRKLSLSESTNIIRQIKGTAIEKKRTAQEETIINKMYSSGTIETLAKLPKNEQNKMIQTIEAIVDEKYEELRRKSKSKAIKNLNNSQSTQAER